MSIMTALIAFLPALASAKTAKPSPFDEARKDLKREADMRVAMAHQIIDLKIANEQQEREIENLRDQNAGLREYRDCLISLHGQAERDLARARLSRDQLMAHYQGIGPLAPQYARGGEQAQNLDMVNPEWMRDWLGSVAEAPPDQMARLLQDAHRQLTGFCDCTPRGGRAGALRGSVGSGT